jgi:hypothetical protein
MKTILLALLAATATVPPQGGKPPSCTNAPVNITVQDFNPGISSDGSLTYVNGSGGVKAILNCNGQSIELSGTRPTYLNLNFSQAVDGAPPAWSSPAPIAFFNIPLGNQFNNAQPYGTEKETFTTFLKVTMANSTGFFYMENPNASLPLNAPSSGVNNSTCTTTLVYVDHYPAGVYATNAPETWDVYPDPQPASCIGAINAYNVGTVVYPLGKNKNGTAQYSAPFHMLIQRQ